MLTYKIKDENTKKEKRKDKNEKPKKINTSKQICALHPVSNSRDVIQAKYMNPSTGQLHFSPPVDRPPETSSITEAKNRARVLQQSLPPAQQLAGFTAHHKYPWSKIRDDIELAFTTIKKTEQSENTLKRLERFSGCQFPVLFDNFVKDESHRKTIYIRNEIKIDEWIRKICWTPSNIFIGPLSNQREDDPGHRVPMTDIDAHYVRSRRMSDVSAATVKMYSERGLQGDGVVPEPTGRVSPYEPNEWQRDVMALNTQYFQIEDPYYRDNIFHYQVIPNIPIKENDYQLPTFSFSIETLDDVEQVQLRYNQWNYMAKVDNKLIRNPVIGVPSVPNKKRWDFTIPVAQGFIHKEFELAMKRNSGTPKVMLIQSIFLKGI